MGTKYWAEDLGRFLSVQRIYSIHSRTYVKMFSCPISVEAAWWPQLYLTQHREHLLVS